VPSFNHQKTFQILEKSFVAIYHVLIFFREKRHIVFYSFSKMDLQKTDVVKIRYIT